jgi:hypothetical protein
MTIKEKLRVINPVVYGFVVLQALLLAITTHTIFFPLLMLFTTSLVEWILAVVLGRQGWLIGMTLCLSLVSRPLLSVIFDHQFPQNLDASYILQMSTALGIGWLILLIVSWIRLKRVHWWMLPIALALLSIYYGVSPTNMNWLDLIFYSGLAIGAGLLVWGIGRKLFGLIIAGSLLLSMSTGTGFSWNRLAFDNPVVQTGVMLVWFGLGWVLITISSRVIWDHFIWWPLIPGGVQIVVGAGTYIAGYLTQTQKGNTNPILIASFLFGIYIFIYRVGFRR